jgi:hypothetical protein
MTDTEMVLLVVAAGVIVGASVFLLLVWRFGESLTRAQKGALTPEQLRDVSDLTQQLDRLVKDIDGKIAEHLSRIDAAIAQADAKTAQLHQAALSDPQPRDYPVDLSQNEQLSQAQAEEAGQPIWEPPPSAQGGQYDGLTQPPQGSPLEDELVTLPGTWPVPPSRSESATPRATPRMASRLQSPRHAEVLRLHKQGLTATDIARKLRMDVGEVELVLRLHGAGAEPC